MTDGGENILADLETADIPESYFEYVARFEKPMFRAWSIPNKCIEALYPEVSSYGATLGDVTWNQETKSARDLQIVINVPKLRATLRVGLEAAVFNVSNPDWSEGPQLIEAFQRSLAAIRHAGEATVSSQEVALAMHVRPGKTTKPFRDVLASLIDTKRIGEAQAFGLVTYNDDSSTLIDKSTRYADAVFIRVFRTFPPSREFVAIAAQIYEDESKALALFGLQELME